MPAAPRSAVRGAGKNKLHAFFHAVPGGAYMITYGDLREGGFSAPKIKMLNPETMLSSNRDGLISGSQAVLVSESRLKWQGFPAREIVFDIPQLKVRGRSLLIYAAPYLYQVSALMPKAKASTPTVRGFIDSFRTSTPRS